MTRPTLEVADILRAQGDRFLDRYRSSFDFQQLEGFRAIQRCRTAALGGHRDICLRCGHEAISYNSCRNRPCPKCQTQARQRWLAARERELLTTNYFHVVFTVPPELPVLALDNARAYPTTCCSLPARKPCWRSRPALARTCCAFHVPHTAFSVRCPSSGSHLGSKLPFKSHNSTRPPQTRAASS